MEALTVFPSLLSLGVDWFLIMLMTTTWACQHKSKCSFLKLDLLRGEIRKAYPSIFLCDVTWSLKQTNDKILHGFWSFLSDTKENRVDSPPSTHNDSRLLLWDVGECVSVTVGGSARRWPWPPLLIDGPPLCYWDMLVIFIMKCN